MIRGQAKNPATVHHHHQRNPSSSSQRSTYLNIPGLQRSTDASAAPRRTSTSPSPSSNFTNAGPVPIRTRPERAAKTQARAALRISPDGTEASGNSDEDEELGSASDDGGDDHGRNRSAIDVDHPMSIKDSRKIRGAYSEVPKLFDSSSVRGAASSTATPSFPNSPLHGAGGLGELDGGFSGEFYAFFHPTISLFFVRVFSSLARLASLQSSPPLPHYESDRRVHPNSNPDCGGRSVIRFPF